MTFREKLMKEHPECIGINFTGGCDGCPRDYGYADSDIVCPSGMNCKECWDREIPVTNIELADKIADTHHKLIERGFNEGYAEKVILSLIEKEYFKK